MMKGFSSSGVFQAIVLLVVTGLACPSNGQTFTTFDPPNSIGTLPQSINLLGQIAGFYQDLSGSHGFLRLADGTIAVFDPPGSSNTNANAINLLGQITGYFSGTDSISHGFLRKPDGTIETFDAPAGNAGPFQGIFPLAINDFGQITGYYNTSSGEHGFLRQLNGTITAIDDDPSDPGTPGFCGGLPCGAVLLSRAINLEGQVAGTYYESIDADTFSHGFLRQRDGTIVRFDVIPSPTKVGGTFPAAINAVGQIAGQFRSQGGGITNGFIRQRDGSITTFDPDNSRMTITSAMNLEGKISGYYLGANGIFYAFLRKRDGTILNLGANVFAVSINDLGQVTGYYQDSNFVVHGFVRGMNERFEQQYP